MTSRFKLTPFVEKLKTDPPILLVCALGCTFWLGRLSFETPSKTEVCKEYIDENSRLKTRISNLEDNVKLLDVQLERCRKECEERLRTRLDVKDSECTDRLSEKISQVKESFIHFKCHNCKRLGKCK